VKYFKGLILFGVVFLLIVLLAAESFAQRPDRDWGRQKGKHAKNLENLRMLKLLEVLELDEEQDIKFIAAFASFRKNNREIGENVQKEVELLAEILHQTTPSEEDIMTQILKIEKMRIERENAVVDFHKEVTNILTPVQMGRMVIFEHHFERELIESVRGFRERHAPPLPEPDEVPEPGDIPEP
jgi:hypothetical protein